MGAKPRPRRSTDYHPDSFAKAIPTPVSVPIPSLYTFMQNQEPSCGGDSVTQYLDVIYGGVGSPMFTWRNIRNIDGLPATDGSESSTLGKEAQSIGTCDLTLMSDDSTLSNADYAAYTGITPALLANAASRKIANYAFIDDPTLQQIKDNIFQHKAAILRVNCGDGWWTSKSGVASWAEADILPSRLGNYVDDHFICVTAFDENYIYFQNSWSVEWCRQGLGYFDSTYIPYVKELVIFVPAVTPVTPTPATYRFIKDIHYGDTSADVHNLQGRLGMPSQLQTGYFGFITLCAVVKYEITNHLPISGTVGQQMRNTLNQ